jgi:putative ABC transport system ATP-binding protein
MPSPDIAPRPIVRVQNVIKRYPGKGGTFTALHGVSLEVNPGEFVAVVGRSGSGKTTLLNIVAGIDSPSVGRVTVAGTELFGRSEDELAAFRGRHIGVVFQFFQLLPVLTVIENVMLPMDFCDVLPPGERRAAALAILERLGISAQADKLPADLSGGEQQRAAIARALANDPPLLVADEPTGNLDSRTAAEVMGLFADLVASGKTVLMVTHERDHRHLFSRVVTLSDGTIQGEVAVQGARDHVRSPALQELPREEVRRRA